MKKGKLKRQSYTLINLSKLGTKNCTPLKCEDCGATIFNIATIKGKDNKVYTVGLTCLKKLLKYDTVLFSESEKSKMAAIEKIYNNAINARRFVDKCIENLKRNKTNFILKKTKLANGNFCITADKKIGDSISTGFWTIPLDNRTSELFSDLKFEIEA